MKEKLTKYFARKHRLAVLEIISNNNGMTPDEVYQTREFGATKSPVAKALAVLFKDGYITRFPNFENLRTFKYYTTYEGLEAYCIVTGRLKTRGPNMHRHKKATNLDKGPLVTIRGEER